MQHVKDYFSSWKVDLVFWITLVIDALTWLVGGGILSYTFFFIQRRASSLAAGNSAATIQQYMLSLPPDQLAAFSADLKLFVIQFIGALILLPIVLLILYAASRSFLFNIVERNHWNVSKLHKWVAAVALMVVLLFLYGAGVIIIRQVLILLPLKVFAVLYSIVLALALVHVLVLTFLVKRNVARTHLVWQSIGDAFAGLRHQHKTVIWGTLTLIVLQAVQIPLNDFYFVYPTLGTFIQLAIFVVFAAWLRMVTLRHVPKDKRKY